MLMTREHYETEKRRDDLTEALRQKGVEVWRRKQPVAVLEAFLDVLERAEKGEIK